jgi:hypothetical protein
VGRARAPRPIPIAGRSIDRSTGYAFLKFCATPCVALRLRAASAYAASNMIRGNDRLANEPQEFVTRVNMNEDKAHESGVPRHDEVRHIDIRNMQVESSVLHGFYADAVISDLTMSISRYNRFLY